MVQGCSLGFVWGYEKPQPYSVIRYQSTEIYSSREPTVRETTTFSTKLAIRMNYLTFSLDN